MCVLTYLQGWPRTERTEWHAIVQLHLFMHTFMQMLNYLYLGQHMYVHAGVQMHTLTGFNAQSPNVVYIEND